MPHDRYFSEEDLILGKTVVLSGSELHHLQHVMRKKKEDIVALINGKGQLAKAKILSLAKEKSLLEILEVKTQKRPPPSLYLAQSWIASAKLDWILEKGCEMGVTKFFLISSDFSSKPFASESKNDRMRAILISSIKQCGRLDLPKISKCPDLSFFFSLKATFLFGDIREKAPFLKEYLAAHPLQKPPCLLIGPEKGFSPREILFLEEKLMASGVSFHSNILRSETAAIMGLSLLSHYLL